MTIIESGMNHLMKSMNIDPEQMKAAVLGFQTVMQEIQTHLLAIEREQARQGAILEKLSGEHNGTLGHPPARNLGNESGQSRTGV
jgi:hypothetical protein